MFARRFRSRRDLLRAGGVAAVAAVAGCSSSCPDSEPPTPSSVVRADAAPTGTLDASGGRWPTYRHDAGNTGYGADVVPPGGDPALRWRTTVAADPYPASAPVLADGALYVVDGEGTLHALAARDGNARWTAATARGAAAPTVRGGRVFVAGEERVVAVGIDGAVAWTDGNLEAVAAPVAADGTLYVPAEGALHALDAATGERRWRVSLDGPASRAAVGDERVFAVGGDIAAVDPASGDVAWRERVGGSPAPLPVAADGLVYAGTYDGLTARDAATGEVRWTFERGGGRGFSAPVVAPDALYAVETPGEGPHAVYALDPDTGEPAPRWCSWLGEGAVFGAAGEHVFVETRVPDDAPAGGHAVQAFRRDTGDARWQFRASGRVRAPAFGGGAAFFVAGDAVCAVGGGRG